MLRALRKSRKALKIATAHMRVLYSIRCELDILYILKRLALKNFLRFSLAQKVGFWNAWEIDFLPPLV